MGNIIIEDESGKVIYYGAIMFDLVDSLTDKGLTALETEALTFVVAATHDTKYNYASKVLSRLLGYNVKICIGFKTNQPFVNSLEEL